MTSTIPLTDIGITDTTRRDRYGRYLVVPPIGGKPTGYTRVTTVAKALDEGGGLAPWKATMAVQGVILRKGLFAQWEALMATCGGDPWYAGKESKSECKRLVEDAAAVGGANDRRDQGSAMHTITALLDVGRTPGSLSDETQRDLTAYQTGLMEAGISIEPDCVELTVVLDEWLVAGTLDRIVSVPGFELPLIADLKTGDSLEYSWQSIAVQLAAYSRANALYTQGANPDGSEDIRTDMPAVDQHHGLIFWLPVGSGELHIIAVDLVAGWEAFEQSMWARQWRNKKLAIDLSELMKDAPNEDASDSRLPPPPPEDLTELLVSSVEQNERKVMDRFPGTTVASTDDYEATQHEAAAIRPEVRAWLQRRITRIGETPGARSTFLTRWPTGLPFLKASDEHTGEQLAAIEHLLDDVEAAHRMPFPEERPSGTNTEQSNVLSLFPTQEKTKT